ncbi:MAG: hypothetical protein WCJ84_01085 [Candidatus Peregrinibacteria bacterium]
MPSNAFQSVTQNTHSLSKKTEENSGEMKKVIFADSSSSRFFIIGGVVILLLGLGALYFSFFSAHTPRIKSPQNIVSSPSAIPNVVPPLNPHTVPALEPDY